MRVGTPGHVTPWALSSDARERVGSCIAGDQASAALSLQGVMVAVGPTPALWDFVHLLWGAADEVPPHGREDTL